VKRTSIGNDREVLSSGVLIDGRYRLDDRLATGGMGDVWRAHDVSLGRTVAIKILLPALVADPAFGARFRSEARMLAALHHPGVVRVYDYGEAGGPAGDPVTYLVMEYVDGEPLSHLLTERERLSPADTMAMVAQAAQALHAAHRAGIVHRDVKPSNLLLKSDGSVMLVDFGVARSTAATTSITSTNAIIGTAMYMAPEQASGGRISAATDIYALGAVAYHCLAGHPPFIGGSPLEIALRHVTAEPPELPADIPAPVRELVDRALAKEPAHRFPDAASFASAARAVVAAPAFASTLIAGSAGTGDTTVALPDTPVAGSVATRPAIPPPRTAPDGPTVAQPSRRGPSKRVVTAAVAAALLVLAAVTTLLLLANRGDSGSPGGGNVPPSSESPTRARTSTATQPGGGAPPTRRSPTQARSGAPSTGAPAGGETDAPSQESTPSEAPPTTPAGGGATSEQAANSPTPQDAPDETPPASAPAG
jgi:eukaryotic-like serine/threonine-protein kinase